MSHSTEKQTDLRHMETCPVCGHKNWKTIYRIKDWDIGECTACRFARIDPLPVHESRPEFYKKEQVVGRNIRKKPPIVRFSRKLKSFSNKLLKRSKGNIFYEKLVKYAVAGGNVLDIGCGDGSFLEAAKKDFKCHGIEISDYLADCARTRGGMEITTGNFQDLDLGGKKFDAITLISLIEHLDDPLGAVQKSYDHLNDGGVFLIKTVNYNCLNRMIVRDKWTGLRPPDHIVYFDPRNLKSMLEKVGFKKFKFSAWPFNDNMYCDAWK